MIYVYGIFYKYLTYAAQSVESILRCATEPINLTIIESAGDHSRYWEQQRQYVQQYVTFEQNVRGYGLTETYRQYPPDRSEDFFVFTDLDILVDFDWIHEIRRLRRTNPDKVLTGFGLKTDNYIPPNNGFVDHGFGTWLMSIGRQEFETYHLNRYAGRPCPYWDGLMLASFPWIRSEFRLTHLGWDTWKDYPELWKEKLIGTNWAEIPPNLNHTSPWLGRCPETLA